MSFFSIDKASSYNSWAENTWIERDAEQVLTGVTDDDWKKFPDVDVLAFISMEDTDKIPLVWIDGDVYYYSEAMKVIKDLNKKITMPDIEEQHSSIAMTA